MMIACLALSIALGGTASAAVLITGKQVKDGSVSARDIANRSLTGLDVKDKSLTPLDFNGSVEGPRARLGPLVRPAQRARQGHKAPRATEAKRDQPVRAVPPAPSVRPELRAPGA